MRGVLYKKNIPYKTYTELFLNIPDIEYVMPAGVALCCQKRLSTVHQWRAFPLRERKGFLSCAKAGDMKAAFKPAEKKCRQGDHGQVVGPHCYEHFGKAECV